ncbi:unnamed protein product [Gordionus sp. m RMFG-2023]|uniref:intraflagellar transport protein che-13-like n=1 Tax=Gordionus sp. m RMFG-2023 TaxID=3053472 RepID=UPI0030E3FF9F
METLLLKLNILNYGLYYCQKFNKTPINKHYFCLNFNTGDQYYSFISLAIWLINSLNPPEPIKMPEESDDPNIIVSKIVKFLSNHDTGLEFSINKLKKGYGDQVINLLNYLADLNIQNQKVLSKYLKQSKTQNIENKNDDIIIKDERPNSEMDSSNSSSSYNSSSEDDGSQSKAHRNIPDKNNSDEWRSEYQDALPRLLIMKEKIDAMDDQNRLKQMESLFSNMAQVFVNVEDSLNNMLSKHASALSSLREKEKNLNDLVDAKYPDFKDSHRNLIFIKDEILIEMTDIEEKTKLLDKLTADVEETKKEIRKKVDSMSDSKGLNKAQKLIGRLEADIAEMDVKINFSSNILSF